ncbi:MAG: acyl-CoA dehydrogenase family protein [Chloroflexi bacterium]|nr:acyl-CoA dehydrogenase family protein [Chloroflexota bacterium]
MDFRFGPEDEAFRGEVRTFLRQELGQDWEPATGRESVTPEQWSFMRGFTKKLAGQGWLTMAWPKEYGGSGASTMRQLVYNEEMSYTGAPAATGSGISLAGPTIMVHGTEEQKREFLPPIARGDVVWCQLFSEPGSGSDLASLQTRAVADGDDFIVNGQKIWTSGAHHSDWAILLARSDPDAPKHRGITYFLVDMKSPGVEVRPLVNMVNGHAFNEVFMENVRIPRRQVVGEVNRGWYVGATTLDFERSGIGRFAGSRRVLEELTAYAKNTRHNGGRLIDKAGPELAERVIENTVGRDLAYRVAWMQSAGKIPNYEASMVKVYGSELQQRIANTAVHLLGLGGQLTEGSAHAPLGGRMAMHYLGNVAATIAAGTSEIQRNIIATRGLGLPRG